MIKKNLFYTCIFLFISISLYSQERITISGRVYLNEVKEVVSGIYVKNQLTGYTTVTDITGNFSIQAKKGDILIFQSFNIQTRPVVVTENMQNNKNMSVYLNVKEIEIEDIKIIPFKSYGSIELDVKRIPMMNETNKLLAKLGDLTPDRKYDGSTDLSTESEKASKVKIGIDGILDVVSGNAKKKERLSAYEQQMEAIKTIREYYGDEYFNGIGLKNNEIEEFILYTYLNQDVKFFYEHNNYFQILNVFDKTILVYKERKKEPTVKPKVGQKYFPE